MSKGTRGAFCLARKWGWGRTLLELKPHEALMVLRARKGLTQEGLAALLGCSQMQVSRYERGVMEPSENEKKVLENYFGRSIWNFKEKA
jgi:ribosome-binding protein aMBF1 (putative translation factor)